MADQTVTVRLRADIAAYKAAMAEATRSTDAMSKAGQAQLNRLGGGMQKVGRNLTKFVSLPLAAVGVGAAFVAVKWESAWAGVTKTVDGTTKQMAKLETGLRDMAKNDVSATHAEIAAVAEAAGQLGVKTPAVLGFTKVMVDMGETTDLSADQAASALARLANITQMPQTQFDRLGATVVDLGNKSASTESEIVDMSLGLAAAGSQVGLTEAQILAFAASLSSVGIEAEAGGSSFSRVFTTMGDAVQDQTKKLQTFAQVAGVSADEFTSSFRDDAGGAIAMFIEGLGRMTEQGQSVTQVLDQLGFSDIRVTRALKSIAGAGDLVNNMLSTGTKAWGDNTALQVEAEKRYATTAAELEMLRNKAVDLGIDIGGMLTPALSGMVDIGTDVVGFLQDLDPGAQQAAISIGLVVAAVGPLMSIGGKLVSNLKAIGTGFQLLASGGKSALGFLANPFVAGTLAAGAAMLYAHQRAKALHDSFTTSGAAAEALADSVGITLHALDDLSAGADKAAERTEASFAELNAKAITTLRDLQEGLDTDAFLIQIGYSMVLRGAKPEQVIENLQRLADAAGVQMPIELNEASVGKFSTQLEAVATTAGRLGERVAEAWHSGSSIIFSDMKRDFTSISDAAEQAFQMDKVARGVKILMEAEEAFRAAGLEGWQLTNAMEVLFQEFVAGAGVTGVSVTNFDSMSEAVGRLAGEESSLSSQHKAVIDSMLNTPPVAAAADAIRGVASATGAAVTAAVPAKRAADDHAQGLKAQGDAAGYTAGQIQKVTDALQENFDVLRGGLDAQIGYEQALDDLAAAFENEHGKVTAASRAFDIHTQSGRDNALAMRDVGNAVVGLMQQRIEEGGTLRDAIAVGDMYVANLKDQMRQAGYTDAEIDMLVAAYGLVPKDIATKIEAKGLPEETNKVGEHKAKIDETDGATANTAVNAETAIAEARLRTILAVIGAIPTSKTITVTTVSQVQGPVPGSTHAMPRAGGGPVGPGQLYLVGEEGPELVTFSSAGLVHDADSTSKMLKGGGDSGQRVGIAIGEGFGDGIALGVWRSIPKTGAALRGMNSDLLAEMDALAQQLAQAAEDAVSGAWEDVAARETRQQVRKALHEAEREVERTKRQIANARDAERAAERRVAALSTPITETRLDGRIATTARMLARARRSGDSDTALNAAWDLGILKDQRREQLAAKNAARRGELRDAKADRQSARQQVADLRDQLDSARQAVEDASRAFVEANTAMITKSKQSREEWRHAARQAGLTTAEINALVAAYQDLAQVEKATRPVTKAAGDRESIDQAIATLFAKAGAELDPDLAANLARQVHKGRMDIGDIKARAKWEATVQANERREERKEAQLAKLEKRVENLFHAHNQSISDYDAKQAAARLYAGTQSWAALEAFVAALPARALGGPVRAGGMYLVGERGPEIYSPARDGQIIPHTATGAFAAAMAGGRGAGAEMVAELRALRTQVEQMRPITVNQGPVTDATARDIAVRGARQIAFAQVTSGE